jgi:FkbM family methyltransferase
MTTSELLAETVESARIREGEAFDKLTLETEARIVLYGAGRLGRKAANALSRRGIEPLAFADNNVRLQGSNVNGVSVLSPADAAERWGSSALFVVTTFLPAGGGVQSRLNELVSLGCRHTTSFLTLGWKFDGVLPHFGGELPSQLIEHASELKQVAALWCDDLSLETFEQALTWRLRADFKGIVAPQPDQYFPRDILTPNSDEAFVDGGAFDGDTLRAAPWRLAQIIAIEPDPANAVILRASCTKTAEVHQVLLGSAAGSARFNGMATMASSRSDAGALELPVVTLDELTAGKFPTFLKLDVEGDELAALHGGVEMLRWAQPVVAVCVYHRPEDLWTIPLFLHEVLPAHRIFIRAHAWDGFELVAYAVPPKRCIHQR